MEKKELNDREREVIETLKRVKEPETDLDLVSLGIVYGFTIKGDSIDVWMDFQGKTPGCFFCKTLAWSIIEKISKDIIKELKSIGFKTIRIVESTNPNIVYKSFG